MDHFTPHEDLLDVKLRDLLFFLLIFEHRKLIDAAKAMKISVPTAERKLKSLRSAFGDSLFTRGGTKGFFMVPTSVLQISIRRSRQSFKHTKLHVLKSHLSHWKFGTPFILQ